MTVISAGSFTRQETRRRKRERYVQRPAVFGATASSATDERQGLERNGRALRRPEAVVQVVEATAQTLPEHIRSSQCQATIGTHGKASGDDSSRLGWVVELELEVGGNVTCPAQVVLQDAVA